MTETNTVVNTIEESFKSISGELATMSKTTRALQDQLKSLQRVVRQSSKSGRVKQKRPQVKMALSKDLQKFLAVDKGTTLTKAEVMKELLHSDESIIFIDDHPDNCLNVLESFPDAEIWLMSRPFNADFKHPEIRRANDWSEVLKHSGIPASN